MNLIVFHKFFNLGHVSEHFSHLLHIHIVCRFMPCFLGFDDLLSFSIYSLHHKSQMLVPEPHPEIVLVIQVHSPIISLGFAVFGYISDIIDNVLVVKVVYNWGNDVKAAIDNQHVRCRHSRLYSL